MKNNRAENRMGGLGETVGGREGGREREQDKEFVISLSAEKKKIMLF